MNHTIEVKNVYKSFKNIEVLHDVSLQADKGSICGIIGRNGSGKTVLFKCICGFLQTDRGEIQIEGKAVGRDKSTLSNLGIIIESPGFLRHYSGYKNLGFLMGLNGKPDREKINDVLDLVGLAEQKNKKVGKYSMGMRQRLGIAQAIMEDPEFLILDEPFNGLDHRGAAEIRKILLEQKEQGKTILLASHNGEDIRILCDRVFEMDGGVMREVRR